MRRLLILLAALFAAAPVVAQQPQVYHGDSGYAVDLPDGGVRVSH